MVKNSTANALIQSLAVIKYRLQMMFFTLIPARAGSFGCFLQQDAVFSFACVPRFKDDH